MTNVELKAMCYKIIDLVEYVEQMGRLGDCNTCMCQKNCTHVPKPGQSVRINCFAYVGKEETVK